MKAIGGLLFAIGTCIVAICCKTYLQFDNVAFGMLLGFGLIISAAIAFFDRIKKVKFMPAEIELAESRIDEVANKGIARIELVVEKQAERIEHLASGLPEMVLDGAAWRTVMVYTDESGKRYAEYRDKNGERKKKYLDKP